MQEIEFLFPRAREMGDHDAAKVYIQTRMVELINSGEFYLTACMLQPESDLVGEIIFGQALDPDTRKNTASWSTAPEIEDLRVRLESVQYDNDVLTKTKVPIKYKRGFKSVSTLSLANLGGHAMTVDGRTVSQVRVDDIVETGKSEGDFSIRAAWTILKQHGVYCTPATTAEAKRRRWTVREVPPNELKKGKK